MILLTKKRLSLLLASMALTGMAHAADVTGAGSSFVFPVISAWSQDYTKAKPETKINYQSIGSGGGIAQIKAGTVDFGASDAPMAEADLTSLGLGQFPTIIGGIVPVVNIEGIEAGKLVLDGPVLADIYLGNIKKWNDPKITALNPGLNLPDQAISVVQRADGSGTSYNFTNYLSKVSPEFKEKLGFGSSVKWPVGVGGKGNEGVAAYVKQIKGSIGYVEYSYATQNKISYTSLKNAAGKVIKPDAKAFADAAATADWKSAKDFNVIMTNAPGDNAWPITATTWVIMYKQPKDAEKSKAAFDFFNWSLTKGQPQAEKLEYVALPVNLVNQIQDYWKAEFKK